MEIFVGISIGPRSTPCPRPQDQTERAKKGPFQKSESNSSFWILFWTDKTLVVFDKEVFGQQQPQSTAFAQKRGGKPGQTEKQPNRKPVKDIGQKLHFCNWAGVCYQFFHIADSEITALILHNNVF
jgi:hypothetical protein